MCSSHFHSNLVSFPWISYVEIQLCRDERINYRLIIRNNICYFTDDWKKKHNILGSKYKSISFDHDNCTKKKEKSISPHYRIPLIVEKKIKSLQILLTWQYKLYFLYGSILI